MSDLYLALPNVLIFIKSDEVLSLELIYLKIDFRYKILENQCQIHAQHL